MKKTVQLTILLAILSLMGIAQDNDALARRYYTTSEELFNKKNHEDYEKCVDELEKAEKVLNATTPDILYLKLEAMYQFCDLSTMNPPFQYYRYDIEKGLQTFFKITDSKTYPASKYADIIKIDKEFKDYRAKYPDEVSFPNFRKSATGLFERARVYLFNTSNPARREAATAAYLEAFAMDTAFSKTNKFLKELVDIVFTKLYIEKLFIGAAERGSLYAINKLAYRYYTGWFGPVDCKKAIMWYSKAADKGDPVALASLGFFYSSKNTENKCVDTYDLTKATEWYLKGAKMGDPGSMRGLSEIYKSNGDALKAKEWSDRFSEAALFPVIDASKFYTHAVYSSLPSIQLTTFNSKEVDLKTELRNLKFKDKPTLIMTWSVVWCQECTKKIDSLLDLAIQDKYNIILINKNEGPDNKALREWINKNHPKWNKTNLLFDRKDGLKSFNKEAPYLIWLDKDFNVIYSYIGKAIEASKIVNLLDNINSNRIVASNIKNVYYNDIPVETEDKAPIKYVVTEVADKIKLQIYYKMNKVAILKKECYYYKDPNGILTPLSY